MLEQQESSTRRFGEHAEDPEKHRNLPQAGNWAAKDSGVSARGWYRHTATQLLALLGKQTAPLGSEKQSACLGHYTCTSQDDGLTCLCRGEGFNSLALVLQDEGTGSRGKWDMGTAAATPLRGLCSRTGCQESKAGCISPLQSHLLQPALPSPRVFHTAGGCWVLPALRLAGAVFAVSTFPPAEPCHQHGRTCQGNLPLQQSPG